MKKKREKYIYIQTSWLENPEELQLHHNHEKIQFLIVAVALCAMQNEYW
jgi:hypothetical protein